MPIRLPDPRGLIGELRRRRVFRVAAGYAVAAWLLIEVATTILPTLGAPDWVARVAVVLLLAGLPVTIGLAWVFDITPSGVERTSADHPEVTGRLEVSHPWALALTVLALVSAAFLAIQLVPSPVAAAFPARGWAVLADAENRTGDPVFDEALGMALTLTLEQSAHVNLATRQQVEDALGRMRREPGSPVDAATARQIALREGFAAVLLPSIARVGSRYLVAVRIEYPESEGAGRTLTVEAEGHDDVLDALDRLAMQLREHLGESPLAIERMSQPLERATTASLQALQQYSRAYQAQRRARYQDAKRLYEDAIAMDSTFALALAGLGMLEWERGREAAAGNSAYSDFSADRGIQLLDRAVANLEGVTERERLGIMVFHAIAVQNDFERAITHEQARLEDYPDSYVSYNNIGRMYYYLGRPRESAENYREAIRTYPGLIVSYDGLVATYLYQLMRPDSALLWARRMAEQDSTLYRTYDYIGWAQVGLDSLEQAAEAFTRALEIEPGYTLSRFRLGHTLRLLGRPEDAIQEFRYILDSDPPDSSAHYDLAAVYDAAGDPASAVPHLRLGAASAEAGLRRRPTPEGYFTLAGIRLRMGDTLAADSIAELGRRLQRQSPKDQARTASRRFLGLDAQGHFERAAFESLRGRVDSAMAALQAAYDEGLTNLIWVRIHPDFHGLRGDPAFEGFLDERLSLP
ncbi:MAG: tetratricopeptide repeat protein [Gemmatimonadota bacterium]|jgi:tetratricopeptide (TPR) repeat protein